MTVIERIKNLQLPVDQLIVIGSGLLDAYGLRTSNDLDLVVSDQLYHTLRASGDYTPTIKGTEEYLVADTIEVWRDWGAGMDFVDLQTTAVTIDGVMFVHPSILVEKKRQRGTDKDIRDIALLEAYDQHRR